MNPASKPQQSKRLGNGAIMALCFVFAGGMVGMAYAAGYIMRLSSIHSISCIRTHYYISSIICTKTCSCISTKNCVITTSVIIRNTYTIN